VRYIIIGAGAVGGSIGGRLHESGHEVVLVARGAHYEAIRDRGLTLRTPEDVLRLPVPVVDGPEALAVREDDVLVLSVKTQDTTAALDAWAPAAAHLPLVCAQNGVESERIALRRFARVYGMCVWLPSSYLEPGEIVAPGAPFTGMLHIGRAQGGTDDTALRIAGALEKSHFLAPVVPDVMRWKYAKLLSNLGNAVRALCGPPVSEADETLRRRTYAEGAAVLDAAGIVHTSEAEQAELRGEQVEVRPVEGSTLLGGSSWQSLARGTGSIEADYLNGEIVLLGRQYGVPTPVNETLQRLANAAARERRSPGSMTVDEVTAAVEALDVG
jgi:2-dehydropantoate 2-reductase